MHPSERKVRITENTLVYVQLYGCNSHSDHSVLLETEHF